MFSNYDFSVMFFILAFVILGTWLLVKRALWLELLSKNHFKKKHKPKKQKSKNENHY